MGSRMRSRLGLKALAKEALARRPLVRKIRAREVLARKAQTFVHEQVSEFAGGRERLLGGVESK